MKPPSRKRIIRVSVVAALLVGVAIAVKVFVYPPLPDEPRISVSKETTFLTEPLDEDGFPDYIAAVNRRHSKGVTPENNTAVLLFRAYGPTDIEKEHRKEFFKALGMDALPVEGEYCVSQLDFEERLRKQGVKLPYGDLGIAPVFSEVPWKRTEQQLRAQWLDENRKPLRLAMEASRRQKFFVPVQPPYLLTDYSAVTPGRQAVRLLVPRGLMHIGEGRLDAARDHALAIHRLARLWSQSYGATGHVISAAFEANAHAIDRPLIEYGRLKSKSAVAYQQELDELGELPLPIVAFEFDDRCSVLQQIIAFARGQISLKDQFPNAYEDIGESWARHGDRVRLQMVDWNEVLRFANTTSDQIVAIIRMKNREKRIEAFNKLDAEFEKLRTRTGELRQYMKGLPFSGRNRTGVTDWFKFKFTEVLPRSARGTLNAVDRNNMRFEITLLALGLVAFHDDNGRYPDSLSQLKPKYARRIPIDRFSGEKLIYKRIDGGFLLYSVGANRKDEGGKGYNEGPETEDDDLPIRIPPWPKPDLNED